MSINVLNKIQFCLMFIQIFAALIATYAAYKIITISNKINKKK